MFKSNKVALRPSALVIFALLLIGTTACGELGSTSWCGAIRGGGCADSSNVAEEDQARNGNTQTQRMTLNVFEAADAPEELVECGALPKVVSLSPEQIKDARAGAVQTAARWAEQHCGGQANASLELDEMSLYQTTKVACLSSSRNIVKRPVKVELFAANGIARYSCVTEPRPTTSDLKPSNSLVPLHADRLTVEPILIDIDLDIACTAGDASCCTDLGCCTDAGGGDGYCGERFIPDFEEGPETQF